MDLIKYINWDIIIVCVVEINGITTDFKLIYCIDFNGQRTLNCFVLQLPNMVLQKNQLAVWVYVSSSVDQLNRLLFDVLDGGVTVNSGGCVGM